MKRLSLILLLALPAIFCANAQNVYTQIRQKASASVYDVATAPVVRQFSRFKLDALDYLGMKMKEKMPDSTVVYLDKQALALNHFMSLYTQTLLENRTQPAAYQVKLMKLFIDASVSNPLFNDTDKELVNSYVANADSPTRFSLDTDWQRAYIAVSMELKKNR